MGHDLKGLVKELTTGGLISAEQQQVGSLRRDPCGHGGVEHEVPLPLYQMGIVRRNARPAVRRWAQMEALVLNGRRGSHTSGQGEVEHEVPPPLHSSYFGHSIGGCLPGRLLGLAPWNLPAQQHPTCCGVHRCRSELRFRVQSSCGQLLSAGFTSRAYWFYESYPVLVALDCPLAADGSPSAAPASTTDRSNKQKFAKLACQQECGCRTVFPTNYFSVAGAEQWFPEEFAKAFQWNTGVHQMLISACMTCFDRCLGQCALTRVAWFASHRAWEFEDQKGISMGFPSCMDLENLEKI
eukprot:1149345-Pelagomonas_calceolata.AAC.5